MGQTVLCAFVLLDLRGITDIQSSCLLQLKGADKLLNSWNLTSLALILALTGKAPHQKGLQTNLMAAHLELLMHLSREALFLTVFRVHR